MITNYFKTAYRNIARNKFYTFLNVLGLSIGFTVFIFIFLFVKDELTYDTYHKNKDRIYRIASDFNIANKPEQFAIVPVPMGPALKLEYPEVEKFCRMSPVGDALIKYNNKEFYEPDIYVADSTVFDIFTHKFILGDAKQSLNRPNTIVLTQKFATKYFGQENPMGKSLKTGDGTSLMVSGVIEDLPENSHMKFSALISLVTRANAIGVEQFNSLSPNMFWNIGLYTFLLMEEGHTMDGIHEKFPQFYKKYMASIGDQINASFNLLSMPLTEIHLNSNLSSELPTGNKSFVLILIAVAVFILAIAAINYMNMATARSIKRAREVGIRKVMGALRGQLIRQFLSESVLLAFISMLIAVFVVYILMNDFNALAAKDLSLNLGSELGVVFLITIFIGLVSGSYPAFYLSNFIPVKVLKGTVSGGSKNSGLLRKVLVVFQFFMAIVMIIGTLIVSGQLQFLKSKDLGYNKEDIVILQMQDTGFRNKHEIFRKELLTNPNIIDATNTMGYPGNISAIQVVRVEGENKMVDDACLLAHVDFNFLKVFDIKIIEGRGFDRSMGTDKMEAVVINEAAVKKFNWEGKAIGKKIHYGFDLQGNVRRPLKVIGVMQDFHFKSLKNNVEAVMFFISQQPRFYMAIKINGNNQKETLNFIEKKWNEFGANRPFSSEFLTQQLDDMYTAESKVGTIFRIVTILTIFIALLGLLGLSSFITEQRTKEIGIRKILGAGIPTILQLLAKEFIILIGLAFMIAIPVSWWQFDKWLNNSFVYFKEIDWVVFFIGGLIALVVGLLTISYHIIKAASSNPVDAIKYE